MIVAWPGWAALLLASCSADQGSNTMAFAAAGTAVEKPMTGADRLFRQEFRASYASVLWRMMVLRWCDKRWHRPSETAAAESRLAAIDALAIRWGLKPEMAQAADDNARQMAVMRLDVHCHGGFDRFHASAEEALGKLEKIMRGRKKARR